MRMRGLLGEQRALKETLESQDEAKRQFKEQVHDAMNNITDYKKFKKSIIKLYKMYVTEEMKPKKQDDTDSTQDFIKLRANMQRNVSHLKNAQQKAVTSH